MLRKQALNAVWPLQNKLTENNYVLSPIPGTPLAELVKANLKAGDAFYIQDGENYVAPCDLLERNSLEKDQLDVCRHDIVLTELVGTIGKSLGNQLDVARNIVQPMVREAFEKIEIEERKRHRINQCQYDIVPLFFNGIWDSAILESMTEKYANSPIMVNQLSFLSRLYPDIRDLETLRRVQPALHDQDTFLAARSSRLQTKVSDPQHNFRSIRPSGYVF